MIQHDTIGIFAYLQNVTDITLLMIILNNIRHINRLDFFKLKYSNLKLNDFISQFMPDNCKISQTVTEIKHSYLFW